jgi:predicted DCC family thiol-disulfide oxidoreductase YuxK
MLENRVIIYDDNCPMCKLYTSGFVRMGILRADHRVGFGSADEELTSALDLRRARHEIPLVDISTGEVTYGLDALFVLISHRFPVFGPLFRNSRFRALLYRLYEVVTYNRRVIAGCAAPKGGFNCAPDFNRAVRLKYLRVALTVWALMVSGAAGMALLANQRLFAVLALACAGVQAVRCSLALRRRCFWDRLGGLATNALLFGLLLAPSLLPLPATVRLANLALAFVTTLLDALRRERNCRRCPGCVKCRSTQK